MDGVGRHYACKTSVIEHSERFVRSAPYSSRRGDEPNCLPFVARENGKMVPAPHWVRQSGHHGMPAINPMPGIGRFLGML
jgi:hypothetical protein